MAREPGKPMTDQARSVPYAGRLFPHGSPCPAGGRFPCHRARFGGGTWPRRADTGRTDGHPRTGQGARNGRDASHLPATGRAGRAAGENYFALPWFATAAIFASIAAASPR